MRTLIGIGFGPANLALAAALVESPHQLRNVEFLERQERFGWHRDMLLPGTTMQISFLKDLVTLRDPRSEFSFLNYLAQRGRLCDFINLKTFHPTRIEYHDYLSWVADRIPVPVRYGQTVHAVAVVGDRRRGYAYQVVSSDLAGREHRRVARHLVIGTGLVPRTPDLFPDDSRITHTARFLSAMRGLDRAAPLRFAVLGAGQSAAEVAGYLHSEFPNGTVHTVHSRFGYSPADDSPFTNRVFDPETVDLFYDADPVRKAALLRYHANTNYSVVDGDVITALYRRHYAELVGGPVRLVQHRGAEITAVRPSADALELQVREFDGRTVRMDVDLLVLGTGYAPMDPQRLFANPGRYFQLDEQGRFVVDRDYGVCHRTPGLGAVFLQGDLERSHGLTGSLLSNLAVRAELIARALLNRQGAALTERGAAAA